MVFNKNVFIKAEVFENPFLSMQLKVLRILGFINETNQRYQHWNFIRSIIVIVSFVSILVINSIRVSRYVHIIEADLTLRATTISGFTFAIYTINFFFQRERIARLSNFMHEDFLRIRSCGDDLENQLFQKSVKYVRRITYIFVIQTTFNGCFTCLNLLVQSILHPDVIYDQVLSPEKLNGTVKPIILLQSFPIGEVVNNFIVGYIGSLYIMLLYCTSVPFFRTVGACLFMFGVFKIEILKKRMRDMNLLKFHPELRSRIELHEGEKNECRLKMSEYCAEEQIKLRWFSHELKQFLQIPVFVDFFVFSLTICLLLYTILVGNLSMEENGFVIIFITSLAAYQLLCHYHATLFTKAHEELCLSIYSCDWYNYPVQIQKHIHLNMMETCKPLIVMAFNVPLRLQTVLDILKGAFSYYSVLRNIIGKEN